MTVHPHVRSPRRRRLLLPLFLVAVSTLLWCASDRAPTPTPITNDVPATSAPPCEPASATRAHAAAHTTTLRIAVEPAPATTDQRADFTELINRLVEHGNETTRLAQADEIELAKASDQLARATFAAILSTFADAGERALALASGLATPDDDAHHNAVCHVCRMVLAAELDRREQQCNATGDRTPIEPLVSAVLDMLPVGERLADSAGATLIDKPHLRLRHEPAIVHLVDLAAAGEFPRSIATRLLLTLWHNVEQFGERSSDELASLALLLLGDDDPSRRAAACRHLLLQPRYRQAMLAWLREHGDRDVAAELARMAAAELPPADAVAVLRELGPLLPNLATAYMALGHRAPQTVALAYEQLLADNVQPAARRDLLAGLGMSADGRQTLQLALHNDPDARVRLQALLSLSASSALACGEAACERLLDDPQINSDAARLSIVVMALENLEVAGMINAVDRLGQRLRQLPLGDEARQRLEQLLARALPGGRTSAGMPR